MKCAQCGTACAACAEAGREYLPTLPYRGRRYRVSWTTIDSVDALTLKGETRAEAARRILDSAFTLVSTAAHVERVVRAALSRNGTAKKRLAKRRAAG